MRNPVRWAWKAWQEHRERKRLMAPMWFHPTSYWWDLKLQFPELLAVEKAGVPELPPYQGLAGVWDGYCTRHPDYPSFLAAQAHRTGSALGSVLELACGTGTLAVRLAGMAPSVVGLDSSADMLEVARGRAGPSVDFVHGDFRDFQLGRSFDAAVCAFNSLNYVADGGELRRVFGAVARHLRPGGRFVFDTTTELGMRAMAGRYLHVDLGERRFAMRFNYDRERRSQTACILLPAGVELHRRVPIDTPDVVTAAAGTGLDLVDAFTDRGLAGTTFFVLARE